MWGVPTRESPKSDGLSRITIAAPLSSRFKLILGSRESEMHSQTRSVTRMVSHSIARYSTLSNLDLKRRPVAATTPAPLYCVREIFRLSSSSVTRTADESVWNECRKDKLEPRLSTRLHICDYNLTSFIPYFDLSRRRLQCSTSVRAPNKRNSTEMCSNYRRRRSQTPNTRYTCLSPHITRRHSV